MLVQEGPSPCCPKGAYGPCRDVRACCLKGKYDKLPTGPDCYVVEGPAGTKKGIILMSDIMGFDTGRHFEIADALAERCGAVVIVPDFFRAIAPHGYDGDLRASWGFVRRLPRLVKTMKNTKWPQVREDFAATVTLLKGLGVEKAGCLGFCWGGYGVWRVCGEEEFAPVFLTCGVTCHPSVHNVPGYNGNSR